jgi:hypothetical protein
MHEYPVPILLTLRKSCDSEMLYCACCVQYGKEYEIHMAHFMPSRTLRVVAISITVRKDLCLLMV